VGGVSTIVLHGPVLHGPVPQGAIEKAGYGGVAQGRGDGVVGVGEGADASAIHGEDLGGRGVEVSAEYLPVARCPSSDGDPGAA
jgi:hypothetical protein